MKLFVDKNDTVTVHIYVYEKNNEIEAVVSQEEVPSDIKFEKIGFSFRKPSYKDSSQMLAASQNFINGEFHIDAMNLSSQVVNRLLADWDIKDSDGNKVPCDTTNISNIHPSILRAAVGKVMNIIKI